LVRLGCIHTHAEPKVNCQPPSLTNAGASAHARADMTDHRHDGPPQRGPRPPRRDEAGDDPTQPIWLWGQHTARAALANPDRRFLRILVTRNGADGLPEWAATHKGYELVDPAAITGQLPPGAVHQGLAVLARPVEPKSMEAACFPADARPVVVLDQVTDPQNVGAIWRTAAAFGARALVRQDRRSAPITGALAKAAAGAVETVPDVQVVNIARAIAELTKRGYLVVGLAGEAELELAEALDDSRPVALVLGAEGKGIRDLVGEHCERLARIPIGAAMESLNVSNAAAIALYAVSQREAS
jgi:23S rRNA (guanosine2251-2'-O)-methyltransferase